VRAWLHAGATVATLSRSTERLQSLTEMSQGLPGRLVARKGTAGASGHLEALLSEVGQVDQAVASIGGGGWRLAPLMTIEEAMFRRIVDDAVVAHWATAKAVLPRVAADGEYVFINGGAALHTVKGAEPMSLVARTQLAMADLIAGEVAPGPRVTSLVLNSPIIARNRPTGRPEWLTADDVGQACLYLRAQAELPRQIVITTRADVDALARDVQ
jgi:3-oxoacyl-[acyl-carrier protein] reductase